MHAKLLDNFTNVRLQVQSCCLDSRTSAQTARHFSLGKSINSNGMRSQEAYGAAGVGQAASTTIVQSQSSPRSTRRIQNFCIVLPYNDSTCNQP